MKKFEELKVEYEDMTKLEQEQFHRKVALRIVAIILFILGCLAELNLFGEAIHTLVDISFWIIIIFILPFGLALWPDKWL